MNTPTILTASSYADAVQNAAHYFVAPELRRMRPVYGALGMPVMSTGANAAVFRVTIDGRERALRCFTNGNIDARSRYVELGRHLDRRGLSFVAGTRWIEDAMSINGVSRPVILMDWIEGRTLDSYVGHLVRTDPTALTVLADRWRDLTRTLSQGDMAHGDLQHGNVMVDQASSLHLVDLDAVWIPTLATQAPPNESGHRHYQHPTRTTSAHWGRWMDAFPALVISTSLRALAVAPRLWDEFHNEDNLIFTDRDFTNPARSAIWPRLSSLGDPRVDRLACVLRACAALGWREEVTHDVLVDRAAVTRSRDVWWAPAAGGTASSVAGSSAASSLPPPPKVGATAPPPTPTFRPPSTQAGAQASWWSTTAPADPAVPAEAAQPAKAASGAAWLILILMVALVLAAAALA